MVRAKTLTKPEHRCADPNVTHLRPHSVGGKWRWKLLLGGMELPIAFCPLCGVRLPLAGTKRRGLTLVKGGGA